METNQAQVGVLRFKNFFGNSFYTNTGFGARQSTFTGVSPDGASEFNLAANEAIYSQSFADAILEFSIGNKWQISYFNIGVDWIGILAPISKIRLPNGGNELDSGTGAASAENDNQFFADTVDQLKPQNSPGTTFSSKLYIGFAF